MTDECASAVAQYLKSLEGSFEVHETDSGCTIVTPFMRRDNDFIELGVEKLPDGRYLLTDYSETINYLILSGVNVFRSRELRRHLDQIAARFNVEISEEEIATYTDADLLGSSLRNMINAVQDAAFLVYKRIRRPPLSFDERVEKVLISGEFKYDSQFQVQGKTKTHTFRFYVNSDNNALVEPLTATSSNSALAKAERLAFRWTDIANVSPRYQKFAVLDDDGPRSALWSERPLRILSEYSDGVVLWSGIDQFVERLSSSRAT